MGRKQDHRNDPSSFQTRVGWPEQVGQDRPLFRSQLGTDGIGNTVDQPIQAFVRFLSGDLLRVHLLDEFLLHVQFQFIV
jgi:hypothetical protein